MDFLWVSLVIITSFTGLIGFSILLLNYRYIYSRKWKKITYYSILYFITSFFNWLNLLFNICFPKYLILTNIIWCFTIMWNPVFLFLMIECYAGVRSSSIRRLFIYGVPTIGFLAVFMIFFNYLASQSYTGLTFLLDSSPAVILISIIGSGYMLMNLYMIWKYQSQQIENKSDTNKKESFLTISKGVCLILLVMSPVWFIFIPESIIYQLITNIFILAFCLLHIFLVTEILLIGNENKKVRFSEPKEISPTQIIENRDIKVSSINNSSETQLSAITLSLNKKCFNEWIKAKKPYLNPELKIEELAILYGVSVRDLSSFLNREYRMNFNRYINRCRLVELRQLKVKNKRARLTELVPMAGFGSMISYSRAKASLEKKSTSS